MKKDYLKPAQEVIAVRTTHLCDGSDQQGDGGGDYEPDAKDDDIEGWDFVWGE